jgi:hypothetical protein
VVGRLETIFHRSRIDRDRAYWAGLGKVRPAMNLSDPRWPALMAVAVGLVGGYVIIQDSPLSWVALLLSTALIAGVLYLVLRKRKPNAPRPPR